MTPQELLDSFRTYIDDTVEPTLWSDDEIYEYMDDAQREFCFLTDYLVDSTTYDAVAVTAGTRFVDLPEAVYYIRRARWDGVTLAIVKQMDLSTTKVPLVDDYGVKAVTDWESDTGVPKMLVTDMEPAKVRLVPYPSADGTLSLDVLRLPLKTVSELTTKFEVTDEAAQRLFKYWMAHLAYQKDDVDINDPEKSELNRTRFMQGVDRYRNRYSHRRRKVGVMAYGGL